MDTHIHNSSSLMNFLLIDGSVLFDWWQWFDITRASDVTREAKGKIMVEFLNMSHLVINNNSVVLVVCCIGVIFSHVIDWHALLIWQWWYNLSAYNASSASENSWQIKLIRIWAMTSQVFPHIHTHFRIIRLCINLNIEYHWPLMKSPYVCRLQSAPSSCLSGRTYLELCTQMTTTGNAEVLGAMSQCV